MIIMPSTVYKLISKEMAEKNQMSLMKKVNTLCNNLNLNDYLNIITK